MLKAEGREVNDISSVIVLPYCGGVLAPNGLIYFIPHNADNIGVFNPSTRAFSVIDISSVIAHDAKYVGGVLAPNGHIYFVPYTADSIGDFDPSTGGFSVISISVSLCATPLRGYKYEGGVLAPDGHIYFVPCNANCIGDFDPATGIFTFIDISSFITHGIKYCGGVLAPNGLISFVPTNADNAKRSHLLRAQNAVKAEGREVDAPHLHWMGEGKCVRWDMSRHLLRLGKEMSRCCLPSVCLPTHTQTHTHTCIHTYILGFRV